MSVRKTSYLPDDKDVSQIHDLWHLHAYISAITPTNVSKYKTYKKVCKLEIIKQERQAVSQKLLM